MEHSYATATFLVRGVFPGNGGGAIFYGDDADGNNITAALNYKISHRIPQADEVWRVEGTLNPHADYPKTIQARRAFPIIPPVGALTRQYLLTSERFRGFGFGAARLAKLEEKLSEKGLSLHAALSERRISLIASVLSIGMAEKLVRTWYDAVSELEIYEFLDSHNFDKGLASLVLKVFKRNTVKRLRENPYRLIAFGTSTNRIWRQAEEAALLLGLNRQDPRRLAAAVEQALYDRLEDGHTLTNLEKLKSIVLGLLKETNDFVFEAAIRAAAAEKGLVKCGSGLQALGPACMEANVEARLASLTRSDMRRKQLELFNPEETKLEELLTEINAEFANRYPGGMNNEQISAVRAICQSALCVISGGAGTGKTSALRAIHEIVERTGGKMFQLALAGRAKERLEEATGRKAFTIHAFIERLKKGVIEPNSKDAVTVDNGTLIVLDEASMVDLSILSRLFRLLPENIRIAFVGDPAQLPPVGFGIVFHKLIGVPEVVTIELTQIVRQEDRTGIPGISRLVRSGLIPDLPDFNGAAEGVFFQKIDASADMAATLFGISERLEHECQILTARKRFGRDSSHRVNLFFQHRIAGAQHEKQPLKWKLFVGDPVIVTKNNYDLGLFNGALGVLTRVDGSSAYFRFDKHERSLTDEQMVELGITLAYGITVHKAQGSEFDRVVIPVTEFKGLDRSLLYTALTRARKQAVFVGSWEAFCRAVQAEPRVYSIDVGFDLRAALGRKEVTEC